MSGVADVSPVLAPGDPLRGAAARALATSGGCAAFFTLFAWTTTQVHDVRLQSPWQSDPYDLVVTFTLFAVPVLLGFCVLRAQLCRRTEPLPLERLAGLLHAARLGAAMIGATVATDWVALALRGDYRDWGPSTAWLIAALALQTAWVALAYRLVLRLRLVGSPRGDWLSDLPDIAELVTTWIVVPAVAKRMAARGFTGIRRHPFVLAGFLASSSAVCVAGWLALREGQSPGLFALETWVWASGCVSLLWLGNRAVGFVSIPAPTTARDRLARAACVGACSAVPLALGLRDQLWAVTGRPGAVDSLTQLMYLLACAAVVGALVGVCAACLRRH